MIVNQVIPAAAAESTAPVGNHGRIHTPNLVTRIQMVFRTGPRFP